MTKAMARKEHKEHQEAIKPLLKHLKKDEQKMARETAVKAKIARKSSPMKKQTKKDREDESRGMKRYESRMKKDREDESRGMKRYEKDKKRSGKMESPKGKFRTVMEEYKEGKLHSGSKTGPKVTKKKQAEAIGFSEERRRASTDESRGMKRYERNKRR